MMGEHGDPRPDQERVVALQEVTALEQQLEKDPKSANIAVLVLKVAAYAARNGFNRFNEMVADAIPGGAEVAGRVGPSAEGQLNKPEHVKQLKIALDELKQRLR